MTVQSIRDASATALGRRDFLTGSAIVTAALAGTPLASAFASDRPKAAYLVPGYRVDIAAFRDQAVMDSPDLRRAFPAGYDGTGTLLTRVDEEDGSVRRALMPLRGHAIAVAPDSKRAIWASMNGDSLLSFDPRSLEIETFAPAHGDDFIGGGHAVFTAAGDQVLVAERKRYGAKPARPEQQFGRITIRDPRNLSILESYSCHGVSPHQIRILADGRHIAISNYGSTNLPGPGEPLQILEPSLTVLELASGRLTAKWIGPDPRFELRHLAAHSLDRIAAILAHVVPAEDARSLRLSRDRVYEPDLSVEADYAYLPAPIQFYDIAQPDRPKAASLPSDASNARQGQSIVYDPDHDEVIVTFASSHRVIVFDAASGAIKTIIETDRLGLRYPRGLALHPDGVHYAVTGSWRGIQLFRRGGHEADVARALHAVFFDHSHLAIA